MREPEPIIVAHLFPETLDALLEVLAGLSIDEWNAPTVCRNWSVKDIAQHLLGGDIAILARLRDGYAFSGSPIQEWSDLVVMINRLNSEWVTATRRLSPKLLCDLLRFTGRQVCEYFASLDPFALGNPVDWVSPEPAAVWLDLAREYTERWHHQQQMRDAVGRPGLKARRHFAPVLDAFVRALPRTYHDVYAAEGTLIELKIVGESGGTWFLLRTAEAWKLLIEVDRVAMCCVSMSEETAWRLFTRGLNRDKAQSDVKIVGDVALGSKVLDTTSVIA